MTDAASFDAIMQCNLLEVFCEALGAAVVVTDKLDEVTFASVRLLQFFPVRDAAIAPGGKARDLYGALFDAGCRFGGSNGDRGAGRHRDEWIAERIAGSWRERTDSIEQTGPDKWIRIVSRRFSSGLGFLVMQDVSEQKKKEALWRAEQERVRLTEEILDNIPVAIAVKDRNLTFAAVNREFCRIYNVAADDILGRSVWDLVVPELAEQLEERDWKMLSTGNEARDVMQMRSVEGSELNLLYRARRIGKPGQHYITATYSELPAKDGEIIARPEPTWAISCEAATDPARMHVDSSPTPQASMLKRVLLLDEGDVDWNPVTRSLLDHQVELCALRNDAELRAFIPLAREQGIVIDRLFIAANGSALAYNIAAEAGIKVSILNTQQDASALVSAICQMLHVSLEQRSKPAAERGTRRMELQPAPIEPPLETKPLASIIAVEDSSINQLVLSQLLENTSVPFAIAASGQQAISLVRQNSPRLILVDITLPDMSLVDFAHDARKIVPGTPIIGIMPSDDSRNRAACLDAGLDGCFAKPMSADVIEDYVRRHLQSTPRTAPSGMS